MNTVIVQVRRVVGLSKAINAALTAFALALALALQNWIATGDLDVTQVRYTGGGLVAALIIGAVVYLTGVKGAEVDVTELHKAAAAAYAGDDKQKKPERRRNLGGKTVPLAMMMALACFFSVLAMPTTADAQMPPNSYFPVYSASGTYITCGSSGPRNVAYDTYSAASFGGDWSHWYTRNTTGAWSPDLLNSTETRCLNDGITLRVRWWHFDFYVGPGPRPSRVGCKFWADMINGGVQIGTHHVEWCGAL